MVSLFNTTRFLLICLGSGLLLSSCKYEDIVKADYPQQILYMPAAKNGVFSIASIVTSGAYRFTVNSAEKKVIIPLSVYRGGVSNDGDLTVNITANADTVSKLISSSALVGTTLLPADKSVLPGTVTIAGGSYVTPFDLKIDLDYLRSIPAGQKLALAVTIASSQVPVNPVLKTTLITFDPAILKPVPDFTSKADATTARKIAFTNASLNAVGYSWDFGDGSAAVTDASPTYTYSKAGTFTVTLTATGITGSADAAKKTVTLTIP
ncbi:PKD domain-containing protein [uncultured Fibrella sp.]|uniref:PKD domain-containing protein n=1 Tax=uncultured Fibrella sp. TaxID=1284596 RepID=UPI0035CAA7F2